MAHYDLEEQEQLDELKAWWKQHGNRITNIVLVIAVAVLVWQGWKMYQRQQAAQASAVYAVLEQAFRAKDAQRIKAASAELTDKYAGTPYATLGTMIAARYSFENGDLKNARAQLAWVVEKGQDEARDVARLRLAAVMLDDKAYDEALKLLDQSHNALFDAMYEEQKGDVLAAQGKKAEARTAYKQALDLQEKRAKEEGNSEAKRTPQREILQQKLDALGGAA